MDLLLVSFIAGVLTVLAPCVFPLLPVIIGGSVADKNPMRPVIITLSLAASLVVFTLILKATTALLGVPPWVWKWISGGIVILFGLTYLFPTLWAKVMHATGMEARSQQALQSSNKEGGIWGMVLVGASLGPVFASCSPTYGIIIATVLPQSFLIGLINLIVYALGLALVMFIVAYFGQKAIKNMKWAVNPNGSFRKVLGILFIIVGVAVITGYDKVFEAWVLDMGYFDATFIEHQLIDSTTEY